MTPDMDLDAIEQAAKALVDENGDFSRPPAESSARKQTALAAFHGECGPVTVLALVAALRRETEARNRAEDALERAWLSVDEWKPRAETAESKFENARQDRDIARRDRDEAREVVESVFYVLNHKASRYRRDFASMLSTIADQVEALRGIVDGEEWKARALAAEQAIEEVGAELGMDDGASLLCPATGVTRVAAEVYRRALAAEAVAKCFDGVTAEDCECAARVVENEKRFDGYSDRESRKKQARFVDALGRLAAVLRDRERSHEGT